MVKVIRYRDGSFFQQECKACGSVLEYTKEDVVEEPFYGSSGVILNKAYLLECPVCGYNIPASFTLREFEDPEK